MGFCFTCLAQVKSSYHTGKKEKLPVDLLILTEQTEPLHEPLRLPCLLFVPQFHPWHQSFQSPGSKDDIVSFVAHNQQFLECDFTVLGGAFLILRQHTNENIPFWTFSCERNTCCHVNLLVKTWCLCRENMNSSTPPSSEHSRFSHFSVQSLTETGAHPDGTF